MTLKRIVGLALALVCLAAFASVAEAKHKRKSVKTKVTMAVTYNKAANTATASGKVKSKKAACRKRRKVKVIQDNYPSPNTTLGKAKSSKSGAYSVTWSGNVPVYVTSSVSVKVAKRKVGKTVCKAATSRSFNPNTGGYTH